MDVTILHIIDGRVITAVVILVVTVLFFIKFKSLPKTNEKAIKSAKTPALVIAGPSSSGKTALFSLVCAITNNLSL